MPFAFHQTSLPGVIRIVPKVFGDHRGRFFELFKDSDFEEAGIQAKIIQVNVSRSAKGILRGLHMQKAPHEQGKIVTCIAGSIWDVAVDVRPGSAMFGQWFGLELSADEPQLLYVPPGFLHGFCVLSDSADVMYSVTHAEYCPEAECGILWSDPDLAVDWPVKNPILSEKDTQLPPLESLWNRLVTVSLDDS